MTETRSDPRWHGGRLRERYSVVNGQTIIPQRPGELCREDCAQTCGAVVRNQARETVTYRCGSVTRPAYRLPRARRPNAPVFTAERHPDVGPFACAECGTVGDVGTLGIFEASPAIIAPVCAEHWDYGSLLFLGLANGLRLLGFDVHISEEAQDFPDELAEGAALVGVVAAITHTVFGGGVAA